jgi:NAD-dependent SIR2 family protein deacetylase
MGSVELRPEIVYILGAGFSYDAGVPLQSQILGSIRQFELMDLPSLLSERFLTAQSKIFDFIDKIFQEVPNPRLEDVFTIIDQNIQRRSYCVGYDWQELEVVHNALLNAIMLLFHTHESQIPPEAQEFYRSVAGYFVEERVNAGQKGHPFSIISLNWDCVLEDAIYWFLEQCGGNKVDIDYCCYTTPLEGTSRHTPSINQKAMRLFNTKFIKLHGSVNCVVCPNCNRLYTGLGAPRELLEEYIAGKICPRCCSVRGVAGSTALNEPALEPLIISPTFIKEFNNAHIQMIWHNAYIDLCEAKKVVFVGYSLPEADYHLRTLLKRAIRKDAELVVVLTKKDKPPTNCEEHIREKYAASRYSAFFGSAPDTNIRFEFGGVKSYFRDVVESERLGQRIEHLRGLFANTRG